jgi:hypothetical protein
MQRWQSARLESEVSIAQQWLHTPLQPLCGGYGRKQPLIAVNYRLEFAIV